MLMLASTSLHRVMHCCPAADWRFVNLSINSVWHGDVNFAAIVYYCVYLPLLCLLLYYCTYCIYTVSQKKTSHFNFRHILAICWDIFTIFEAPCSRLIAGWCSLLHTHHRCEAFTWRDVTHDVIQAVARSAHSHRISYRLTYGVWTQWT